MPDGKEVMLFYRNNLSVIASQSPPPLSEGRPWHSGKLYLFARGLPYEGELAGATPD